MATPFRLKRSSISGKRPLIGDLELGELALNFYDGYLFARRDTDGVGIADTVSLLNPWVENYGGSSIHYLQSVGIGTTSPSETLTVHGNSYVSGNFNTKTLTASTVTSNNGIFTSFSATGVSTFSSDLNIDGNITSNVTIVSTDDGSSAAPEFKLYRNSASPADADYLGQIKFAGESDTGVERNYAKITGKILDASNGTEDGIIEFAHIKAGSQTITARFRSDSFQLLNDTNLTVAGDSTFSGDLDVNAAIDVDGHTELDELRVSGVSTFVGVATFTDSNVYIENQLFVGGIQIDGGAGGGSSFAGVVTFTDTTNNTLGESNTGALQIDGGVGIDKNLTVGAGLSVGATLNVAGVSTFNGDVTLSGSNTDLVVGGTIRTPNLHSNGSDLTIRGGGNTAAKQSIILDNGGSSAMQILGNSDSTGGITLDTRNSGNILLKHNAITKVTVDSTGIEVNGHSELDTVRITGLSTFTKNVDVNAAIDVDGHTELDELNVAGIATFANVTDNTLGDSNTGALQIDGGLGVDKNVTIGGNLNVQGYSELVGVVTFKGGTINIGDANTDDVNVGGEFISSLIPNTDDTYDLGSDSQQWRNIYINGQAEIDDLNVAGITTTIQFNVGVGGTVITTTETGLVGINSTEPTTTLDVDGTINSSTDVTINGTSVITTATNDAVALAIALG